MRTRRGDPSKRGCVSPRYRVNGVTTRDPLRSDDPKRSVLPDPGDHDVSAAVWNSSHGERTAL
jgi:hypothetical protein